MTFLLALIGWGGAAALALVAFLAGSVFIDKWKNWLIVAGAVAIAAVFAWGLAGYSEANDERATRAEDAAGFAKERAGWQTERASAAAATASAAQAAVKKSAEWQQAVANLDAKHQKELTDAKAENDRLRESARAGNLRVRIKGAACPTASARGGDLPRVPSAAGVGDGEPAYGREVQERVLDLREAIDTGERQLSALQDYARACSGGAP